MKKKIGFDHAIVGVLAFTLVLSAALGIRATSNAQMAAGQNPLPMGSWVIALAVAAVALNAVFVAAETAVLQLKPLHVRHVKEDKADAASRLQELIDQRARFSTACGLGSRFARIVLALVIVLIAAYLDMGDADKGGALHLIAFVRNLVIVAIPVSATNLIVGELVPKSFAAMHPHRIGLRLYGLIRTAAFIFSVPATFLVRVANLVTSRFGGAASFAVPNQAEEEILTIVEETIEIDKEEKALLTSVFEFTDKIAREVMTPRVDLDAMPQTAEATEVLRVMRESGHSRIPLYDGTDDQIVGIVHAKDLLMAVLEDPDVKIQTLMRSALFVPEGKSIHELLREMRTARSQMAVVQDEFGGTAGIVTIEDIVEELVGDIVDEYDDLEPGVQETDTGGYFVEGKMHLDDVNDEMGSKFESEEFDTIGGYVFGLFGRQPKQGEQIAEDGYRFLVVETDGRRISRLKIEAIQGERTDFSPAV